MSDLELVLRSINIFTVALVAGGVTFAQMNVVPLIRTWERDLALKLHRDMVNVNPDRYIRPFAILSIGTAIGALVAAQDLPLSSLILTITAMVLQLGLAVISEAVNQPINRRAHREPVEALLPHYRELARRWDHANAFRTTFALASLACFVVGALEAV